MNKNKKLRKTINLKNLLNLLILNGFNTYLTNMKIPKMNN